MSRVWSGLALLGSSATLVCCVIPAILVALGFGATVAGAISAIPQLTLLSENKALVFGLAGVLIGLSFWARSRPEAQSCPSDPELARACMRARRTSKVLLIASACIYVGALFFVYALPRL